MANNAFIDFGAGQGTDSQDHLRVGCPMPQRAIMCHLRCEHRVLRLAGLAIRELQDGTTPGGLLVIEAVEADGGGRLLEVEQAAAPGVGAFAGVGVADPAPSQTQTLAVQRPFNLQSSSVAHGAEAVAMATSRLPSRSAIIVASTGGSWWGSSPCQPIRTTRRVRGAW